MTLVREIAAEVSGMFLSDARLTGGVLAVVAATALLKAAVPDVPPLLAGGALLLGCLAVLCAAVVLAARRAG